MGVTSPLLRQTPYETVSQPMAFGWLGNRQPAYGHWLVVCLLLGLSSMQGYRIEVACGRIGGDSPGCVHVTNETVRQRMVFGWLVG